jgi:hypothetical protein
VIRFTGVVSPSTQDSVRIELNTRTRRSLDENGIALA